MLGLSELTISRELEDRNQRDGRSAGVSLSADMKIYIAMRQGTRRCRLTGRSVSDVCSERRADVYGLG
jgi:hypothetical protein